MLKLRKLITNQSYKYSSQVQTEALLLNKSYRQDDYTNTTPKITSFIGRNLHVQENHPLSRVRQRIVNYFYKQFVNSRGNPQFSVYDNLPPIVSIDQNFNSLLIPENHPSRAKSDCYYLNRDHLLRAHMTAHQSELIRSGLNNFLMVGDVYRRDEIDSTHYPVFHQLDAVRLKTRDQLFGSNAELDVFEVGSKVSDDKQECHSLEAVKLMEHELKSTLVGLARSLFGEQVQYRWVDSVFPFTHPSWELEVMYNEEWLELLGCGIMRHTILNNAGVTDRIGWAFGLGLERIAMCLYKIPDIRLFWSKDGGFLDQFKVADLNQEITYKKISDYPACTNDLSFWVPDDYSSNDFYDLVRGIGGDLVERVWLKDEFKHPKNGRVSHCYRIVYRHMERTLTQAEVNLVHKEIGRILVKKLGVTLR